MTEQPVTLREIAEWFAFLGFAALIFVALCAVPA